MAGFVEETARKQGVSEPLWMTLGFTDGRTVYAVRYATDSDAPTLYHSRHMDDLHTLNPDLRGRFATHSRAIVSEPIGKLAEAWVEIPQATAAVIRGGEIELKPFRP
jgi:glutamine amidotransferase